MLNIPSTWPRMSAVFLIGAFVTMSDAFAQSGVDQTCGGVEGPSCSVGLFCEAPDAACKEDRPQGTCVVRTEVCTKEYKPVCGCDGKTYGNDCERLAAQARKDHDGPCDKSELPE